MNSTKKLFVAAMIAAAALSGSAATYLISCMRVTGDYPKSLLSIFYGYSSQNNGPGDTAFAQCRNYAESNGVPLFLVYGTESCSSCDSFASSINPLPTHWGVILGRLKCVKAYFRGNNAGTSPKACADAKNFIEEVKAIDTDPKHVDWSSGCHLMVMYSVKPNGKKFVRSGRVATSQENFKSVTDVWYAEWEEWWNAVDETPPNVAFALGAGTTLEAAASTETINVPMVRTNDYATAERPDWLVAKYPDGSVVTNEVACGTDKTLEVPVENRWTKPGDKITLTILNMDLDEMGSSSIKFVDTPANSVAFPYLPGAVDPLAPGEWSVDAGLIAKASVSYDLATNELAEATAAYDIATNVLADAIAAYDFATNALYYAQETNDMATAAYVDATNVLAEAIVAYDAATNTLYYANETNGTATAAYDAATNALEQAMMAYIAASNALYAAEEGLPEYDEALAAYVGATNTLHYAQETNDMATVAYDAATNALAEAIAEYDTATNELFRARSNNVTATAEYAEATNMLAEATAVAGEMATELDNANTAYGNADSRLADAINGFNAADGKYLLVVHGGIVWDNALSALNGDVFSKSEFYDWCTNNQVSLVYLDKAEPDTGASLFSYGVASNGNSGVSFMSINGLTAEQGAALSAQAEVAAEELGLAGTRDACHYQIALMRADGTICGYLRPQFNEDGTCDLAENMARLDELLAQSADEVEAANDTPAGADVLTWGEDADGTLSVNDIVDFFMLSGECGDKDIVFDITPEGEVAECAYPDAVVYRYDEASGECSEVEAVLSIFSMEGVRSYEIVYSVSQDDVDNGRIFVAATAYVEPEAAEAKLGGASAFNYVISVRDATPNPGLVTFDEQPETAVVQAETNQVFEVPLYRMLGKTGEIDITVSIDETLTTATNRYEFVETNVVWAAGEMGIKYVPVTLKGSALNDGLYDITLRIDADAAMADVEKYFTTYTISYGKEPTEAGQLSVRSVTPAASADGRVYVRYSSEGDGTLRTEDEMSVQVNRTGGKGPAAAYISWKNGKETSVETLSWANYLTGTQTAFLTDGFPAPGKNGYADVTMTVTSSNSVSVPMVKDGSTIKVRVLPYDAPLFGQSEVTWSGIQYTTADTNLTMLAMGDGINVKSLTKVSGDVPAGLKVSIEADGRLAVTGTSTAGTGTTSATYLVALTREDGSIVYSMPVTVTFENKALADVNDSFTSARSWKGLPMVADDGFAVNRRLMGLLDLSVAKNGKTSAKYRMAGGKTVSFSSSGLAGVEADGAVKLGAKKSVKIGGETKEYVLSATLGADGSLEASVTDGESEVVASAPTGAKPWGGDNTAERFGGIYTVAYPLADEASADPNTLCWGAVSMQLKCATASAWKKGSVTFAGTLPNGKAVSGTATFVPVAYGATSATLPILSSSSADTFSAMVDIDGDGVAATEDVTPYWRHSEGGIESLSYENDYDAVGSAWSWAAWLDCFGGTFDAKSAFGMSFNLSKASGVAAGTMRAQIGETGPFSIVQWKGIALTGEKKIMGACWRSATIEYDEGRKRTVKIGDAVEMTQE